jgi:DNA repair exonuclease SbcCD nuclease subunit
MLVGNHDAYYKNRSDVHSLGFLKGFPNITIVDEQSYFIHAYGKQLEFVPWNYDMSDDKVDYLFGHFEIQSFKMNNFKVCDHGLSPTKLINKSTNVFSGHFHNRNEKKYAGGSIHYVGNTFPMDFADVDNQKGYYILDIETDELEFFPNTVSPKYKKILVSKLKDVKEEDIKTNIVKLIIDIELTEAKVEKVKAYLGKFRPYQLTTEYAYSTKVGEVSEDIETFDMGKMFDEFIGQLKLEDEKEKRVKAIIDELHEKNSI